MEGTDKVLKNLRRFINEKEEAAKALGDHYAMKAENEAKQDASWVDQTGHARQGLQGSSAVNRNAVLIRLAHTMEYGVHLELANQGRYSVLEPTLKALEDDFFNDIKKLVNK